MLNTLSVRIRYVSCRHLVPKRHPTCGPASWMRSNEIRCLPIFQIYRYCQHRCWRNSKVDWIRDNECTIRNGVVRAAAERNGMQSICLNRRDSYRAIEWESDGHCCDWEICGSKCVRNPDPDLVPAN
jgi:hypothetical protein